MTQKIAAATLLSRARERASALEGLLRELVEIESPSNDPAAVRACGERVVREAARMGLQAELTPVEGAGPIVTGRSPAAAAGERPVMLLGHVDTVWPVGTLAARPIRIEGDRFYGPGCYDMKAGLVVALGAAGLLHEAGALPPVTLFFTPLEEVDGSPYRERMEREMRASRAVLDFEPAWPGGAVKTARKGSGSYVLTAHGKASHAGADLSKGANAILEIARQIEQLSALTDTAGGTSCNVGVVHGGLRSNVVPDRCQVELDVRFVRQEDGERLDAAVRDRRPTVPGVRLELEGGLHYPPLERTPQVLEVYEAARAVAAEMGFELAEVSTGGASEVSFAGALGLPALDGLGADGDGAHALDEHVLLSSLPGRVALTAGLLQRLCA